MNDHKPCPYPDGDDGLLEYGMWQLEKTGLSSQNVSPEMLAKFTQRQPPEARVKIDDIFIQPDIIGSSEYRAIYDCIFDVLEDYADSEQPAVAKSMLEEFIDHAKAMKKRLKKMTKNNRLNAIKKAQPDSL